MQRNLMKELIKKLPEIMLKITIKYNKKLGKNNGGKYDEKSQGQLTMLQFSVKSETPFVLVMRQQRGEVIHFRYKKRPVQADWNKKTTLRARKKTKREETNEARWMMNRNFQS